MAKELLVTWNELASVLPHFVAWAVQKHGPLPDGPVREKDYVRLAAEYHREAG